MSATNSRNPFVVVRLVFLALLLYLSILDLVFSCWNIHDTLVTHTPVSALIIITLINSIFILLMTPLATLEYIYPNFRSSHVQFELAWTVMGALIQIGTSIGVTLSGPPSLSSCNSAASWGACAAYSLLVATSWMTTTTLSIYVLLLIAIAIVHVPRVPGIWKMTVMSIPWFVNWYNQERNIQATIEDGTQSNTGNDIRQPTEKPSPNMEKDSWTLYLREMESTSMERQSAPSKGVAPWARSNNVRRGVDKPFTHRPQLPSDTGSLIRLKLNTPRVPPQTATSASLPPILRQKFRESSLTLRSESPFSIYSEQDKPIPLTRLSQWMTADGQIAPKPTTS